MSRRFKSQAYDAKDSLFTLPCGGFSGVFVLAADAKGDFFRGHFLFNLDLCYWFLGEHGCFGPV